MLPSALRLSNAGGAIFRQLSPQWQAALWRLGIAWLALIAAFLPDWAAMARLWWDISTYNHILLIPAILVWLVWQRGPELLRLEPVTWWPGLVAVAGSAFIWLLGAFSGLDLARQLGAVLVLIAAVLTLLGPKVSAGLVFPLGYMLLLVPFGDELIPPLQMITAFITIALVRASGIPTAIDGVFIDTPAGLFEVAEACSGVKFLIAMVAFGLLIANVCFTSHRRRALVLAACIVVPVLANGVRAFGTIYAAQIVGAERAVGIDHIIYGWVFFAVVIAIIIAGAWRFFDRPGDDPIIDTAAIASSPRLGRIERARVRPLAALAGLFLIVAATQVWASEARGLNAPLPDRIELPEVSGWHRVDYAPGTWWEPRAEGADHRLLGRYADSDGRQVDVFVALYAGQGEEREAGGYGQGALMPGSEWSWMSPGPSFAGARSERLIARGQDKRLAMTWYRTGRLTTGSNVRLKLANMADQTFLRPRATIMLIVSAEDRQEMPALDAIRRFHQAIAPRDPWIDRLAGLQ